jgi:hypothetical protein
VYWFGAVAALVLAFGIYLYFYSPTYVFRYQVTVEVSTPDGTKTGASINEAIFERSKFMEVILAHPMTASDTSGEAIFVDLGRGRNIFLSLTAFGSKSPKARSFSELLVSLYGLPWPALRDDYTSMSAAIDRAQHLGPRTVPFDRLLLMVTFTDLNNPISFKPVDPQHLDATFGHGYVLKSVILQGTQAATTEKIEKLLLWLPRLYKKALDGGPPTDRYPPLMISASNFKR